MERVFDLFLHAEGLENRGGAVVVLHAALRAARDLPHKSGHAFHCFLVVADDFVDLVGEEIAHCPLDEVGFLEDARRCGQLLDLLLDPRPLLEQEGKVAREITFPLPFAFGAERVFGIDQDKLPGRSQIVPLNLLVKITVKV